MADRILLLIISIITLSVCTGYGQRFTHRQYRHDWNDHIPVGIEVKPEFKDYPAVIVYEEVIISLVNPTFKRYARIKFNTREGVDRFNDFILPHAVDPYLFQYTFPADVRDTSYFPLLMEDEINYFDARIIRNGQTYKAVLDELITDVPLKDGARTFPYYFFRFYARNLEPGDELEISYSHKLPYVNRYFFNELMPKQECHVDVKVPAPYLYTVKPRNFMQQPDSSMNKKNTPIYVIYGFEQYDLHPVNPLYDNGAYLDLPYLEFNLARYEDGNSSLLEGIAPVKQILWKDVLFKMVTPYTKAEMDYHLAQPDANAATLNRAFDEIAGKREYLSLTEKVKLIQQYFCDEYEYHNDWKYYHSEVDDLESIRSTLSKKLLRNRFRKQVYDELFYRLRDVFYYTFIPDNRIYALDEKNYTQMAGQRFYYAIKDGESIHFITPKEHRYGLYMDEMPFYLNGCKAFLIPQMVEKSFYYSYPHKIIYPLVYTPFYDEKDNRRKLTMKGNIDLPGNRAGFSSTLDLSGQYSTMTRGGYLYQYRDSTVNKKYSQLVWSQVHGVKDMLVVVQQNKSYPYDCQLGFSWHSEQIIHKTNDSTYTLDMTGMLNFIFPEGFNAHEYHATYYPDFAGTDEFSISLQFTDNIRLMNGSDYLFILNNRFASLRCHVNQVQPNRILIEAGYTIKTERLDAAYINDAGEIFNALHKLSRMKLTMAGNG